MPLMETAFAKINLALHVRRRRDDGYHDLETLFAFAEDGDELRGEPADDLTLDIAGPFAPALTGDAPNDNLVSRAARALRDAFGVTAGAALTLDKRLPVASGIGGGSADAAATLRLLVRLWHLEADDPRIAAIAASLGADVPACLRSRPARGDARGDRLEPIEEGPLAGMPLLLVNPGIAVSTATVFARWDGVDRGALDRELPMAAARAGRNDLEPAACVLAPEIDGVLAFLAAAPGVRLARMSGSGATCFALFTSLDARDAAATMIDAVGRGWWRLPTRLRAAVL